MDFHHPLIEPVSPISESFNHTAHAMSTKKKSKEGYPGHRTPGRTRFTLALGKRICDRIADGAALLDLSRETGIPYRTMRRWAKDYPGFGRDYEQACEMRLCFLEERILELCRQMHEAAAKGGVAARLEIEASRLEIDTIKWMLTRLLPARWGEKSKLELTGADGEALLPKHTLEEDRAYLAMLAETQKKLTEQP